MCSAVGMIIVSRRHRLYESIGVLGCTSAFGLRSHQHIFLFLLLRTTRRLRCDLCLSCWRVPRCACGTVAADFLCVSS